MTNVEELNNVLKALRDETIGRMLNEDKELEFDIRLASVEALLSAYTIQTGTPVPLPEFCTSDELFMLEMLLA